MTWRHGNRASEFGVYGGVFEWQVPPPTLTGELARRIQHRERKPQTLKVKVADFDAKVKLFHRDYFPPSGLRLWLE